MDPHQKRKVLDRISKLIIQHGDVQPYDNVREYPLDLIKLVIYNIEYSLRYDSRYEFQSWTIFGWMTHLNSMTIPDSFIWRLSLEGHEFWRRIFSENDYTLAKVLYPELNFDTPSVSISAVSMVDTLTPTYPETDNYKISEDVVVNSEFMTYIINEFEFTQIV